MISVTAASRRSGSRGPSPSASLTTAATRSARAPAGRMRRSSSIRSSTSSASTSRSSPGADAMRGSRAARALRCSTRPRSGDAAPVTPRLPRARRPPVSGAHAAPTASAPTRAPRPRRRPGQLPGDRRADEAPERAGPDLAASGPSAHHEPRTAPPSRCPASTAARRAPLSVGGHTSRIRAPSHPTREPGPGVDDHPPLLPRGLAHGRDEGPHRGRAPARGGARYRRGREQRHAGRVPAGRLPRMRRGELAGDGQEVGRRATPHRLPARREVAAVVVQVDQPRRRLRGRRGGERETRGQDARPQPLRRRRTPR